MTKDKDNTKPMTATDFWATDQEPNVNPFAEPFEFAEAYADYRLEFEREQQHDVSGSLLSDVDYWKQRCLLAEKCLEESPCDPDITANQIKAWNAYHKFISWAGNDR